MLKVYLIAVVLILSPVSYCCIPPPKLLSPILPLNERLLSAGCACCLLVRAGKPVQQNCSLVSAGGGLCYQSTGTVGKAAAGFHVKQALVLFQWERETTLPVLQVQSCRRVWILITCWASVLECGMKPSQGATALTGQPKAYTAEHKLQGKRQVAGGKEMCEQREEIR